MCLELNYGNQSKVVQAMSMLPSRTKLNLEKLTFRQPPKSSFFQQECLQMLDRLNFVKIIWNVFEVGYSTAIDQGLSRLQDLEMVQSFYLEMLMINMLYIIQLGPKLDPISHKITRYIKLKFLKELCEQ